MKEIELKFQIPAHARAALHADICQTTMAMEGAAPESLAPLALHAAYFDTPDQALARQHMALRMRREGHAWVQTFKGAGLDAMTRVEENIAISPPQDGMLAPDLALHSRDAQAALQRACPAWQAALDPHGRTLGLQALYETRFERWHTLRAHALGTVMHCMDVGEIRAGHGAQALSQPLHELELELASGHPLAVIAQAKDCVARYGVWLDVQSKAMKGTRLAQRAASKQPEDAQTAPPAPTSCEQLELLQPPSIDAAAQAWRAWLSTMFDTCSHHASELAMAAPETAAHAMTALASWRAALDQVAAQAQASPLLTAALPHDVIDRTQRLSRQLSGLIARGDVHDDTHDKTQGAAAMARHPDTTLWALDVLQALYGSALNQQPGSL